MADKYAARLKEKNALVQGIKADIKEVLAEKGYGNGVYANFDWSSKPDRFTRVGVMHNTLFFVDNDKCEWHEDNLTNVEELLTILRGVYHIIPR